MPANVVKTQRDERLWTKAKGLTSKEYNVSKGSDRWYKIVMGIYKKMKGGTLEKKAVAPLSMLKVSVPAALRLWWPLSVWQERKRQNIPGKEWRPYIPHSRLKTASVGIGKTIGLIAAAASGTAAGAMLPSAVQKIVDAIQIKRSLDKAKQLFPDLKKFPEKNIQEHYSVIRHVAPRVATNPYLLGSLLRQTAEYEATDPSTLLTISKMHSMMKPELTAFSKAMEPTLRSLTMELMKPTLQDLSKELLVKKKEGT